MEYITLEDKKMDIELNNDNNNNYLTDEAQILCMRYDKLSFFFFGIRASV